MAYLLMKRGFDIALASCALLLLSPVFLLLVILIKITSEGPVLFKQKRVGIHKTYFDILKFRTMRSDTPRNTPPHLLENPEQWMTPIGKYLRKTSLDELPQLVNILKGEMSFVGPRPVLWNQFDLIAERDKYGANRVLPGLTGWAQINGRDELNVAMKAQLDGEYVQNLGLRMDINCFVGTFYRVLRRAGIVEGSTQAVAPVQPPLQDTSLKDPVIK